MIDFIIDIVEEHWEKVWKTIAMWGIVMVLLWILPAKMGLDGGITSEITYTYLWGLIEVSYITILKIVVTIASFPIILFIITKMTE